ncbi:hypothetical protein NE615_27285, partial [Escherichia coli]|nr:hypothetical protein [Escherichia coli]
MKINYPLLALAIGAFGIGTTEFSPMGLLPVIALTLRHYRVFISYCSPSKKKSRADILEMENLVKIIRASLQ